MWYVPSFLLFSSATNSALSAIFLISEICAVFLSPDCFERCCASLLSTTASFPSESTIGCPPRFSIMYCCITLYLVAPCNSSTLFDNSLSDDKSIIESLSTLYCAFLPNGDGRLMECCKFSLTFSKGLDILLVEVTTEPILDVASGLFASMSCETSYKRLPDAAVELCSARPPFTGNLFIFVIS